MFEFNVTRIETIQTPNLIRNLIGSNSIEFEFMMF